eukprot:3837709-Pleurochrysis_carterae.AAC.1
MAYGGARHACQTNHVKAARFLLVISHEVFNRRCGNAPNPSHAHRVRMVQVHGPNTVVRGRSPHRLSRLPKDHAATTQTNTSIRAMHLPGQSRDQLGHMCFDPVAKRF